MRRRSMSTSTSTSITFGPSLGTPSSSSATGFSSFAVFVLTWFVSCLVESRPFSEPARFV